jgi:hypothetical protein
MLTNRCGHDIRSRTWQCSGSKNKFMRTWPGIGGKHLLHLTPAAAAVTTDY